MFKKTLLTTASVVVATCGAMTAANAGNLKLRLIDVNVNTTDDPTLTQHIDKDNSLDENDSAGPNGTGFPINARSIDKGFVDEVKPEGTFSHVVIADERMGGVDNPIGGWYEIDIFEITGAATFGSSARFDFTLEGDADAWFKADVNCANAVRAGSDDIHSISAQTASGADSFKKGANTAGCTVFTSTLTNGNVPDRAVGWTLPIETKACGDLVVKVVVTRADPTGGSLVDETSHRIQTCEDSIESKFAYYPVKIDYAADFRSFLVDPNVYDGREDHVSTLWAHVGWLKFNLNHFLVDLKEDTKSSHTNVFDVSDIAGYDLVVAFENLRGIEAAEICRIGRCESGTLDRDTNTISWSLNNSDVRSQFCFETADGNDKGETDYGCLNWLKIHAWGDPIHNYPEDGPIEHQIAVIAKSEFHLTPDNCSGDHCVKFFTPEEEGVGEQIAQLDKTGIVFGPFDWTTSVGSTVVSIFRLTGVPEELKANLKGHIELSNTSKGPDYKGVWKVDYPDVTGSHDLILTAQRVQQMLVDAGMPNNAEFGRSDMTFTFYVGGKDGLKMDMDRLLASNGTWADYGDNGNDGFSLKARSCDDGRFGPHVANKLDPDFKNFLTGVCSIGELERDRRIFLPF